MNEIAKQPSSESEPPCDSVSPTASLRCEAGVEERRQKDAAAEEDVGSADVYRPKVGSRLTFIVDDRVGNCNIQTQIYGCDRFAPIRSLVACLPMYATAFSGVGVGDGRGRDYRNS